MHSLSCVSLMQIKLRSSIVLQKDSPDFSLSKLLMHRLCLSFTHLSLPHRDNYNAPKGENYTNFLHEDFTNSPRAVSHLGNNLSFVQLAELSHPKRGNTAEKRCQAPSDKCHIAHKDRRRASE